MTALIHAGPIIWEGTSASEKKVGTSADEIFEGNGGADTLYGAGGADILNGTDGKDVLYGGAGDDMLNGALGADLMFGGGGKDRIYISGGDQATGGLGPDNFVMIDYDKSHSYANTGTATVHDFDSTTAKHDIMDMGEFAVTWAERDKGLEDGFEMLRSGTDVVINLKGEDGTIQKIILEDTKMADLQSTDFYFNA